MARVSVSGRLVASSHLFYLSKENKVFILKLQQSDSDFTYVLCSLSRSLQKKTREFCRETLLEPRLDQFLTITSVKCVNLSNDSVQTVFQLTKSSQITSTDVPTQISGVESKLISYRGIVTSVSPGLASVFTLDKRVRVTAALVTVVTNMRSPRPGQEVTIHQAHLASYSGAKWIGLYIIMKSLAQRSIASCVFFSRSRVLNYSVFLIISVLCGASFLHIHDEEDPDVHPDPAEVRSQERNTYIKMIQEGGGWSCQEILQLTFVIMRLHSLFDSEAVPHLVEECVTKSYASESRDRSLIQEFVNHDQACFLKRESPGETRIQPWLSLQELRNIIENNVTDDNNEESWTDIKFEVENVFATFGINSKGTTVIKDRLTEIPAIGEFRNLNPGEILKIEGISTRYHEGKHIFLVKRYRITGKGDVTDICDKLDNIEIGEEEEENFCVLAKSKILRGNQNQELYFYILCDNILEEKVILKTRDLGNYFKIHPGYKIYTNARRNLLDNEIINVCPYFGKHPVFDIGKEHIKCLENVNNVIDQSSFYDIRHLDLIPEEEPINIVATVRGIKKDTEGSTNKWTVALSSSIRTEETISLFLSPPQTEVGWAPGVRQKIFSVVKVMSKKQNAYLISTVMTSSEPVLSCTSDVTESGGDDSVPEVMSLEPLLTNQRPHCPGAWPMGGGLPPLLDTPALVEAVLSLSVGVACGGCGSSVQAGRCSYVGCGVINSFEYSVR